MTEQSTFLDDVIHGLSQNPKTLPSQYFYNETGDRLFQEIMKMPEYYLTKCEAEIFQNQTREIISALEMQKDKPFDLIELGAGDGTKTIHLLKELLQQQYNFTYIPVDISQNAVETLEANISGALPNLKIEATQGDYFQVLDQLSTDDMPKVLLFIGSNLGNMNDATAANFLKKLGAECSESDKLLLGVDLIKSKDIVLPAYHDAGGITKNFNLNLLTRMNDELGADFNIETFDHQPEYSEKEGIAKSYLVSLKDQSVYFKNGERRFHFKKDEKIHTEISRKYDDTVLKSILSGSGFEINNKFLDSKRYYADYVLVKR